MVSLIITIVAMGLGNVFLKMSRFTIKDTMSIVLWKMIGVMGAALIAYLVFRPKISLIVDPAGSIWGILGGVCVLVAGFFFVDTLRTMNISVATPLSSLSFVVSVLIGAFLLREHVSMPQIIAIILMISGFALFTVTTSFSAK